MRRPARRARSPIRQRSASIKSTSITAARRGSLPLARRRDGRRDAAVDRGAERAGAAVSGSDSRAREDQEAPDATVELRALRYSGASAAVATSTCATTACRTRACCTSQTSLGRDSRACCSIRTRSARMRRSRSANSCRARTASCSRTACPTAARTGAPGISATWPPARDLPDVLRFIKFVAGRVDGGFDARCTTRAIRCAPTARAMTRSSAKSIGTCSERRPQTDPLIYKVTDHPTRNPYVQVSDDGRYLVIWLYDGSQQTGIYYRKLGRDGAPAGEFVRLFDTFDAELSVRRRDRRRVLRAHDEGCAECAAHRRCRRRGGAGCWRTIVPETPFRADRRQRSSAAGCWRSIWRTRTRSCAQSI